MTKQIFKIGRISVFYIFLSFTLAIGSNPVGNSEIGEKEGISAPADSFTSDQIAKILTKTRLRPDEFHVAMECAQEYGVDPLLVFSIIRQESQGNYDAVSPRGAVGLMQIMPVTYSEIFDDLELEATQLPKENIRAGVYYFSKLMELFKDSSPEDRIRLALGSYNAGPARIYDAQELSAYLGENPHCWSNIRHALPLLSKRYYSLHATVWSDGKPRSGFFGEWRQTVNYVESAMKIYGDLQRAAG